MFQANPALKRVQDNSSGGSLTINGVIHRTGVLFLLTAAAYAFTWHGVLAGSIPPGAAMLASIVGLVLALIILFGRIANPLLIGAYALAEGVALGVLSVYAEMRFPGIAFQATATTLGCFAAVLTLYRFRVLRATPGFVRALAVAMIGIVVLYLVNLVAGLCGHPLGFLQDSSPLSIGISVVIVLVAALSFVVDFAQIEQAVDAGADERQGWLLAFGLLVGLVWLYIEILRLLMKLRSRD